MKNKKILNAIANIFKVNLKIKKNERLLIFTDNYNKKLANIAKTIALQGRKYTKKINDIRYTTTQSHGAEPPEILWSLAFGDNALKTLQSRRLIKPLLSKKANKRQLQNIEKTIRKFKKEAVNAIIALSYYSTSHTKFRYLLTNICGTRYASMPLFDKAMLTGAMRVNYKKMAKRAKRIVQKVNKSEYIEIKTPNETYLALSKKGRKAKTDTGIITKKGSFSNLPAGEIFFAPVEGSANGKLILEWTPTHKLKQPITLYVENGRVVRIEGKDKYVDYLKTKFSERPENTNIAELGIGTNDKATRLDNILESEKILGTIHIALGDNSSFGGKVSTPFHQDFVFFKPTVVLKDKNGKREILLENGKLVKKRLR